MAPELPGVGGQPQGVPLPRVLPRPQPARHEVADVQVAGGQPAGAAHHRRLGEPGVPPLPHRVRRGLPPARRRHLLRRRRGQLLLLRPHAAGPAAVLLPQVAPPDHVDAVGEDRAGHRGPLRVGSGAARPPLPVLGRGSGARQDHVLGRHQQFPVLRRQGQPRVLVSRARRQVASPAEGSVAAAVTDREPVRQVADLLRRRAGGDGAVQDLPQGVPAQDRQPASSCATRTPRWSTAGSTGRSTCSRTG